MTDATRAITGDLINRIVHIENHFPQTFADVVKRDWGILYVTPTIRDSHDGNHARVFDRDADSEAVVEEVVAFYESRGLAPRVNHFAADGDRPALREALVSAGFEIYCGDPVPPRFYLHRGPSRIDPNPEVKVSRVTDVDESLLEALTKIHNLRMAKVLQRRAPLKSGRLFVGELNGEAVSTVLLERVGDICHIDGVHTAPRHRRRGVARAVVHAGVEYHLKHMDVPLFLWVENPTAERIYIEAGFEKVDLPIVSWGAWRELPR